ncbi:MAG: hypothetical protein FJ290_00280 [Planctomycetes bacterium]|nr:hypothetical protein [Planctomycetota bacterium]
MALRASLSIAGFTLSLTSRHPLELRGLDASYGPFSIPPGSSPEALDVPVRVELGAAPPPVSPRVVFDTGDSWRLSRDGGSYVLALHPRRPSEPELWTARFPCDLTHVTIYCSDQMASKTGDGLAIATPVTYPLDQILLIFLLARHEGALVHAAGVNMGGKGLIFPGKSGAGKSTLAAHLAGREGLRLLSDDRVALRKVGGRFLAYGTPWPGDQGAALNESAPLRAIYFIRRAAANEIVPLGPRGAAERLLRVASVPWYDPEPMTMVLRFLDDLVAHVPAFDLHWRPGPDVAELLERQAT